MLLPPRDARQMAIVQWGLPIMGGLCWTMWARLRPDVPFGPTVFFVMASAAGWVWAVYAGGVSRYGSVHGLVAPWVIAILWLYPLSTALVPNLVPEGGWVLDAAFAAAHALTLAIAGVWHRSRAPLLPQARALQWDGAVIDLARRTITPAKSHSAWWGPALAASLLSIPVYASLRAALSVPEQVALAASVMNLLATWLYVGTMGRVFGQALCLASIERTQPGDRFAHASLREMEGWRRSSWLYRYL